MPTPRIAVNANAHHGRRTCPGMSDFLSVVLSSQSRIEEVGEL